MREILPNELKILADACPKPLYLVGGSVRDFLAGLTPTIHDFDVCSPLPAEAFAQIAAQQGIQVQAVYRHTGTVKLQGKESGYEYACFRSDKYVRGLHRPTEIFFTEDILLDAKRRDFTANAVYYDIAADTFVDPLSGIPAIREKRLTTVDIPNKVFGEDGLRLLRLARQAAQLGFTPDEACLQGAKENASLLQDVSVERVFEELGLLITADQKCGISHAPYAGLRVLAQTDVLTYISPELAKGAGLAQRADFHKYDVLEHSFRAVLYAEELTSDFTVRLAALLHDIGKPACMLRNGNAYGHADEGEALAQALLSRLKAPKKLIAEVCWLVKWHMYDYDCNTGEKKLRRFLVANAPRVANLLLLKQADFSACTDDTSTAPTCARWKHLLAQMQEEGVPFSLKALAVNGRELFEAGVPAERLAATLHELLMHLAVFPQDNDKTKLIKLALRK